MEKYSVKYIVFIHSSVSELLGCFCFLAFMNNAAMNTGVQITVQVSTPKSLGKYPEVELLEYMTIPCLKF